MVDHEPMAQWLVEVTITITTDPTQESQKQGTSYHETVKHIKTTPIRGEHYLSVN